MSVTTRSFRMPGKRGQRLTIHGWIYGLKDGLMHDFGITVHRPEDLQSRYDAALKGA